MRTSSWPELDRLARFVRAADSLSDTLATWTGHGVEAEIVRRVDRVAPDPTVAEQLALYDGARVQERDLRLSSAGVVVACARTWVAVDSAALTPGVREGLRAGNALGELLRPLQSRRVTVRVAAQHANPAGDPAAPVLAVQARLDVAGSPVAWCEETVHEAVFGWDSGRLVGTVLGHRSSRPRIAA